MLLNEADTWQRRGAALLKQGSHGDALAAFDRALGIEPSRFESLIGRAAALMELQRPLDALDTYDRVVALRPQWPEVWYYRGNALKHLKRYDDALASFERALALKPEFPQVHFIRCELFRELGKSAEAAADAESARTPQFQREDCSPEAVCTRSDLHDARRQMGGAGLRRRARRQRHPQR